MDYALVAVLQLIFSVGKVFDIKWSYENRVFPLILSNSVLSATWLVSTALGLEGIVEGDYLMTAVYIISGGIGKWVAVEIDNRVK